MRISRGARNEPPPPPPGAAPDPSGEPGPARTPAHRRLLEAGIFDRDYYEAQTGREFASTVAAAKHFCRHGDHSPHPLLDLASLPTWVREAVARRETGALLTYLRGAGSLRALSPAFHPLDVPATAEARAAHPGGALGLFLAGADDQTPLPGRPELSLGELRRTLVDHARLQLAQARLTRPRTTEDFDEDAERRWRERWRSAPLPEVEGPLVSVVMAVRNRAGVVAIALASLQQQSLQSWELVVVDDGSSDETLTVLHDWAARDGRIRVVSQEWAGVGAARNRGLAQARGRYAAFLDSDNTWRPDFLRLGVAAMHGQDLRAAYAVMTMRDSEDQTRLVHRAFRGSRAELLVVNHVDLNVLLVELDLARAVGGFDDSLRRWVDHDFALRLSGVVDLELLPFVAVDYDNDMAAGDRITTTESSAWQYVVLGRHHVDWEAVSAGVADRVPGRVSVAMPTWNDAAMTIRAVRALLRHSAGVDLEIVVLDNGSRPEVGFSLAAAFAGLPQVRYRRVPRNLNFALGSNLAFAHGTGEFVLFLNNDTEVRAGWWPPLRRRLQDESVLGVQPLLVYPDDTVQTAGTVFPVEGGLPVHYLVDHPLEDVARIADTRFRAVTAAALAMRADDVAALRGFDPLFVNGGEDVDLCLRAAERREGWFVLAPESRVTHRESRTTGRLDQVQENRRHLLRRWDGRMPARDRDRWTELGLRVAHFEGEPVMLPRPRVHVVRPTPEPPPGGGPPALRWGLRLPSVAGARGDDWGDTHFAASLARSLRQLGQEVVSYRHGAHHGPITRFDDVVLGLRGLDVIHPVPGKVNVLWVISHPDQVGVEELGGFDLVYAASPSWARAMSQRSGREVHTLLQATDLRLRADMSTPAGDGSRPVFVGQTVPHRIRPIVHDALRAGVALDVHGPNWGPVIPAEHLRSPYVANDELMATYRRHGLVLADHHDDMARQGFLANRLFDAVASGARVVCDRVAGTELFEGAVQVYADVEELGLLCGPQGRDRFPDDEQMRRIADRVAAAHSFDHRAERLLGEALAVWERRRA